MEGLAGEEIEEEQLAEAEAQVRKHGREGQARLYVGQQVPGCVALRAVLHFIAGWLHMGAVLSSWQPGLLLSFLQCRCNKSCSPVWRLLLPLQTSGCLVCPAAGGTRRGAAARCRG